MNRGTESEKVYTLDMKSVIKYSTTERRLAAD